MSNHSRSGQLLGSMLAMGQYLGVFLALLVVRSIRDLSAGFQESLAPWFSANYIPASLKAGLLGRASLRLGHGMGHPLTLLAVVLCDTELVVTFLEVGTQSTRDVTSTYKSWTISSWACNAVLRPRQSRICDERYLGSQFPKNHCRSQERLTDNNRSMRCPIIFISFRRLTGHHVTASP